MQVPVVSRRGRHPRELEFVSSWTSVLGTELFHTALAEHTGCDGTDLQSQHSRGTGRGISVSSRPAKAA